MDRLKIDSCLITLILFYVSTKFFINTMASPANLFNTIDSSGKMELVPLRLMQTPNAAIQLDDIGVLNRRAKRTKRQLNAVQTKIVSIVSPKPIVDTINEDEKYGNTVDHVFGKKIVKGVENLSNVINAVFTFPVHQVNKGSRAVTDALNQIGGVLVGLQK